MTKPHASSQDNRCRREEEVNHMTIFQSQHPQEQRDTSRSFVPTLRTLWIPFEATIERWADFGREAITPSALVATGTAFYALSWEMTALRHYTLACQERERGDKRLCTVARWLERAIQDLDCAIDQWNQVLSWLHLLGQDGQQDSTSLEAMRSLREEANEHQERRRSLHRQVQQELSTTRYQQHTHRKEQAADVRSEDAHTFS
jgi:hypothetical protein